MNVLDPRLAAVGFSLSGSVLCAANSACFEVASVAEGLQVRLSSGAAVVVEGVRHLAIGSMHELESAMTERTVRRPHTVLPFGD